MDRKLTYPAFGALLVAAAAFGVHIGESAIGQINPLYFQGAAVHPRDRGVAVDENALVEQGPRFAQLYGWEQGQAARNADCFNCDALGARDAYAATNVRYAIAETRFSNDLEPISYSAQTQAEVQPLAAEEAQAPDPYEAQRAELARYSSYAIEAAPDPAQPPVDAAAAADAQD